MRGHDRFDPWHGTCAGGRAQLESAGAIAPAASGHTPSPSSPQESPMAIAQLRPPPLSSILLAPAALALLVLSTWVLVRPASAQTIVADSMGTATEVPWNPPQALASRRGWERVVLL